MKQYNQLDNYLTYLHEGLGKEFWEANKVEIITRLIVLILLVALAIWGIFASTRRDRKLEADLKKVTNRDFLVRIVDVKEPNAFCFGGMGNSVFITTGLLKLLNHREVISVCLHEIGHITNLDSIKSLGVSLTSLGIGGTIAYMGLEELYSSKSAKVKTVLGVVLVLVFGILIIKAPGILVGKLHEYRADRYAVKYGYGNDLVTSLTKLEKWIHEYKRKIYGEPNKFEKAIDKIQRFLDVHPSTKNRVEKLLSNIEMYEKISVNDMDGIKKLVLLAFNK